MALGETQVGDVLVLAPDVRAFDVDEAHTVETRIGQAIKAGSRYVVLDFAAVGQVSGPATRILLMLSRKLDRSEGGLALCGMNAKLWTAFAISGFSKDFAVVGTREEALQRVVEPRPRPVPVEDPPAPVPNAEVAPPPPEAAVVSPPAPAAPQEKAAGPSPVPDPHLAAADGLMAALGSDGPPSTAGVSGGDIRPEWDSLAAAVLTALTPVSCD